MAVRIAPVVFIIVPFVACIAPKEKLRNHALQHERSFTHFGE